MTLFLFLEKYSDWLEAYSIFVDYPNITDVNVYYKENARNNKAAVQDLFSQYKSKCEFSYFSAENTRFFNEFVKRCADDCKSGDIVAASYVRYRDIWQYVPKLKSKNVLTVHLSESFPDSFGPWKYRLAFRFVGGYNVIGHIKQLVLTPMYWLYAKTHQPDLCYFNMYPHVNNDFVVETRKAHIPLLSDSKKDLLDKILGHEKRTLIISGFGYDVEKIVSAINLSRYIATSKNKEIIVDGKVIPLDVFVCAEEVLLTGVVDKVIGYNSTVMCWAVCMNNVEIECYEANDMNIKYGYLYGPLSRKALAKCGVTLHESNMEYMK